MAWPFDDGSVTGNVPVTPEGMALRQRMALAMLGRDRKGYPKNVGEGLTAIGDALGERSQMNQLVAQMSQLERASANRGVRPAALPAAPAAVPGSNDPSTGQQSAAPAPVQTADAAPWLTGGQVSLPPPQASASGSPFPDVAQDTADASPQLPPTAPPVQDASVAPPQQDLSYPQTAANIPSDIISDVPDPGVQRASLPPPDPNIRARIAGALQARQGGPQQNPMLAGQSPASMPSTFSPDDLGSPPDLNNRPIEMPNIQLAEAGTKPAAPVSLPPPDQMPPAVKLPGAPGEPVPAAPREARPVETPYSTPRFEKPPRMADPGPQELDYMKAANDPGVLGSYQKMYAAEAQRMAEKRKLDHDQAMTAYKTRDELLKTGQERASRSTEIELNRQALEDAKQQRERTERISRVFGPSGIAPHEKSIDDSYKNVAGLAHQNKAINEIRTSLNDDRMFTGSTADLQNTRAKLLHAFGWRLNPAVVDTERFATLMAPIVAANRRMISGNQNISDKDVETALKASGGDPKLEKESLLTILDDLQEGSIALATEHQRKIHDLTGALGEKDYEARMYNQRGVPNMEQMVRDEDVQRLVAGSKDPKVHKMFDEAYHTPGLSLRVLSTRR
jgi:hypothetical protein